MSSGVGLNDSFEATGSEGSIASSSSPTSTLVNATADSFAGISVDDGGQFPTSHCGIPMQQILMLEDVDVDMAIFRQYDVFKLDKIFGNCGQCTLHSTVHYQRGLTDEFQNSKARDTEILQDCNGLYLLYVGTAAHYQIIGEFSTIEERLTAKRKAGDMVHHLTADFIQISAAANYFVESHIQIQVACLHFLLRKSGFKTVTLGMHGQKCPYHSFINELVAIERNCKQSPNKVSLDLALKVIPDSRGVPVVHSIEKPSRVQTVYGQKSVAYTNSDGTGKPAAFGTYITRPSRSGVKSCVYPSMFHALKHC
jgi:hypothetical protein